MRERPRSSRARRTSPSKDAGSARPSGDPDRWRPTSCSCPRCQHACTTSPGWFLPVEIERLARHLQLSMEETFRTTLAIGTVRMPDGSRRHGVMPHKLRDHKQPGSKWSLAEMARDGRCIFFDRGRCTIHAVRPYECSRATHGSMDRALRLRLYVAGQWDRKILAFYEKLARGHRRGSPR